MAGIYIHIPFCKRKCHYCNFFSLATTKFRTEFLSALLIEISLQKDYLQLEQIDSIYFGGGTPSLLSFDELNQIFEKLYKYFNISKTAEITLEANPDDLSKEYLADLRKTSVNRLSIGIQSFDNHELEYVNRVHTSEEAIYSVKAAQDNGFHNLSLDLIYGIPISTLSSWESNLKIIEGLNADHLSAYSLTQEPNTAYDVLVKKGKLNAPEDEKAVMQYQMLQDLLSTIQMEQYEISNYARNEKYAVHNTNYWRGISYLGLGPSAHSFNGISRQWNIAQMKKYIDSLNNQNVPSTIELLKLENQWNELIMTGIRTKWGIDMKLIQERFPKAWIDSLHHSAIKQIASGHLMKENGSYVLSKKGKLFADGIAADFFR